MHTTYHLGSGSHGQLFPPWLGTSPPLAMHAGLDYLEGSLYNHYAIV